ncbi:MAG: GIY-YIG nuclease family protein [Burkholderiales bacterium]|nr:GIY-YIG nuclease family protein [Burkholderiales bacterium]
MRVAQITTRIVRVIEVPRSQLADFLKMPEAQQVGVYFLMGELSEAGLPRAYIGQSGNVGTRLVQHNQGKDFWNRAMVVISLTNSMTQTHALFLEWFAIAEATMAGRYSLENGNTGARPHTPAPLEADCHEIHETAATLLATLGQPIFEPLTNAPTAKGEKELFYCKGSGADGVGEYTSEGFVVHKGLKGRAEDSRVHPGHIQRAAAQPVGARRHPCRARWPASLHPRPPVLQPQHGRHGGDR